ncbi:MAG TPA: helix-turn-helix domain-containing protein [Roseiflexaceae bacterium]|nr:helix-turn-helix domain-containing protein [Roseiflexaceae bacterium]
MDEQSTYEPAATLRVTELETLRVLSDALRGRILDRLRAEPLTAKELATRLGLSAKQLYYHLNLMERHGLIRVVRTRVVSGIIEKQYRATAYLFEFDKSVFASAARPGDALPPAVALIFDTTRNQLAQSYEAGAIRGDEAPPQERLLLAWKVARVAPERAAEFYARLSALADEFLAAEEDTDAVERQGYRLFLTLFPLARTRPE